MGLKPWLDGEGYEGLEEPLKGAYVQDGERYRLDVEASDGWGLDNVKPLKDTISKTRAELKRMEARLKAFGDLDPEAARKAMEGDPGKEDERRTLQAKYEQQLAQERTGKEEAVKAMENYIARSDGALAIAAAKGDADLLLPHLLPSLKVVRGEDGSYTSRVTGPDGERITSKPGSLEHMTPQEYVESELKKRFPNAFAGSGVAGSGSRPGAGMPSHGAVTITREQARDHTAYLAAKEAAKSAGTELQITD